MGTRRVYTKLCLIELTVYLRLNQIFLCNRLNTVFSRLKYLRHLVNSTIKSFVDSKVCDQQQLLSPSKETGDAVRVILP